MLHVFLPERAHQTRGVPMLATAIGALKMLHGYREAELVAARVAASKMGFITSPDGDGYTGALLNMGKAQPNTKAKAGDNRSVGLKTSDAPALVKRGRSKK